MKFSAPLESLEPRRLCAVDLYVSAVEFPIGTLGPKEMFEVPISIRNSGTTGVIHPINGKVYLSKDGRLDDNDIIGATFSISSLPAKTTSSLLVEVPLKGRVTKGTYYGLVMIDTDAKVREFDETNNVAASFMASMTVLTASASTVTIAGTDNGDFIGIWQTGDQITVERNSITSLYHSGDVYQFHVETAGGNDEVHVDANIVQSSFLHGGAGHDTITGGSGPDTIRGAVGNDKMAGGYGNDWMYGDAGHDRMNGQAGADRMYGSDGNDYLDGSTSNDWLYGGGGTDVIIGGNGNDLLHSLDGETDTLDGGLGSDTADEDAQDSVTSIEV